MDELTPKWQTVVRMAVVILLVVNVILGYFGANPLPWSESELYEIFSAIAAGLAVIWGLWKNNPITPEAVEADEYMHKLKSAKHAK